jgi:NADH-quinone oxidoreductase subunit L
MMGLVLAPNFLQLFMCWELVGLCSYLLIGFWYSASPKRRARRVKAFWTTKARRRRLADRHRAPVARSGTFDFGELRAMVAEQHAAAGRPLGHSPSASTWARRASRRSSRSTSGCRTRWKARRPSRPDPRRDDGDRGVYLLHRTAWLLRSRRTCSLIVAWIGAFTALLAAVLACVQDDIKRVLAYSTVSQLGYMMAAIGAGFSAPGSSTC